MQPRNLRLAVRTDAAHGIAFEHRAVGVCNLGLAPYVVASRDGAELTDGRSSKRGIRRLYARGVFGVGDGGADYCQRGRCPYRIWI